MSSYLRKKFQHAFRYGSSSQPQNAKDEIPYAESDDETDASDNKDTAEQIEASKVGILRALVEKEDPSAKVLVRIDLRLSKIVLIELISEITGVDDQMIRRFLRARDLDIEKASTMFLKYLSWRKDFVPNGSISISEIPNELVHNKLFVQGQDKIGRPIVVAFGGRHKHVNLDEFKRFVTYALDEVCARMPNEQEKFVAIGDLEGWGYANSDIRGYLAALSILQDCYPERLGKLFIIHVPYIFMTAWKAIYPFIDSKTKKKMIFVENKKLRTTLQQEIDDDQLPDIYGGKLPLVPIQEG